MDKHFRFCQSVGQAGVLDHYPMMLQINKGEQKSHCSFKSLMQIG